MNPYDESATLTAVDYNQVGGGAKGQFGYKADPLILLTRHNSTRLRTQITGS